MLSAALLLVGVIGPQDLGHTQADMEDLYRAQMLPAHWIAQINATVRIPALRYAPAYTWESAPRGYENADWSLLIVTARQTWRAYGFAILMGFCAITPPWDAARGHQDY